ncbi:MAG: hypothetical protein LLG01_13595 [Planctomycetaceae bacterium]|nr:hypothetical protein [Planctomycetaceae bacterium]
MKSYVLIAALIATSLIAGCGCCGKNTESGTCGVWIDRPWYPCCTARNYRSVCPCDPGGVEVPPPPAPLAESIPTVPNPGGDYVWVPGFWDWAGSDYQWVCGSWVIPPGTARVWVPPRYDQRFCKYFYYRGYWRIDGQA